jgi:hypothetical protein
MTGIARILNRDSGAKSGRSRLQKLPVFKKVFKCPVVVVEGQFAVLKNDPYGMFYWMTDAVAVK